MPQKDFIYFIIDENGRSYYDKNGLIDSSSQPKILPESPDGWQEMAIGWERDINGDVGTVRNFSTPLNFVLTARRIILDIFFNNTIEKKIYLLIKRLSLVYDATTYYFIYKYFYRGALDLSTLEDDGAMATVSIAEGEVMQQYKANKGTVYEIPIGKNNPELIKMDGVVQEYSAEMEVIADTYEITTDNKNFIISQFDRPAELQRIYVTTYQALHEEFDSLADTAGYFLKTSNDVTISINVKLDGVISRQTTITPALGSVIIKLVKQDGTVVSELLNQGLIGQYAFTVDEDITVSLTAGDELYLICTITNTGGSPGAWRRLELRQSVISISYTARYDTTNVEALTPATVFKQLTKFITGNELNCDAAFLDQYSHLLITSGDAIRGVTEQKDADGKVIIKAPVIKTSLDQFKQFCKAVLGAGISVEGNKIVIDEYSHFLDYSDPIDLGEVREFKWKYAQDLVGNTVKVGYPDKDISDINGKYEFNTTHTYTTPVTRVTKELEWVSPYLAQPYLIESRRANLDGKKTTDNQQDNDIFVINVDTAARETYNADISAPIEAYQFPDTIHFSTSSDDNDFITSGEAISEFTWAGKAQNVNILVSIEFRQLENAGELQIKRNGTVVSMSPMVPNVNAASTQITVLLNRGDVITIALDGSGSFNLMNAHLTFTYTGARPLKRETYDTISGIPEVSRDSIFNIEELTPKRILKKQAKWVNSVLWKFAGQSLKYTTTDKNGELYTEKGGSYVDEDGMQTITDDRLFIPIWFEFETQVPTDLVSYLEDEPNRCFRFTVEDKTYKGFLVKAAMAAATEQQQTFKLLATPDNDITELKKLIDG